MKRFRYVAEFDAEHISDVPKVSNGLRKVLKLAEESGVIHNAQDVTDGPLHRGSRSLVEKLRHW